MKKKKYCAPEIDITRFGSGENIMTASDSGEGEYDGDKETLVPENSIVDIETFPFG